MTASAPESLIADEWLYDTLRADGTIAAAVSTRIYADVAPQNATFPCIVFTAMPRRDVVVVGASRIWGAFEYNIRAIGPAEGYSTLQDIADAIDSALHAKSGAADSGTGTVLACTREMEIRYPEIVDGVPYRHIGGLYRVLAQKA
jgi:hypothetical protein